jgi:hypothetical protein
VAKWRIRIGGLSRLRADIIARLSFGMHSHGTGKVAAQTREQRVVANVSTTHLPDNLTTQGTLRQKISEPVGKANSCPMDRCRVILEDLPEGSVLGP